MTCWEIFYYTVGTDVPIGSTFPQFETGSHPVSNLTISTTFNTFSHTLWRSHECLFSLWRRPTMIPLLCVSMIMWPCILTYDFGIPNPIKQKFKILPSHLRFCRILKSTNDTIIKITVKSMVNLTSNQPHLLPLTCCIFLTKIRFSSRMETNFFVFLFLNIRIVS